MYNVAKKPLGRLQTVWDLIRITVNTVEVVVELISVFKY